MKCVKCKFKDRNTDVCTYHFAVVAVGDKLLDKNGNVVGVRMVERNKRISTDVDIWIYCSENIL